MLTDEHSLSRLVGGDRACGSLSHSSAQPCCMTTSNAATIRPQMWLRRHNRCCRKPSCCGGCSSSATSLITDPPLTPWPGRQIRNCSKQGSIGHDAGILPCAMPPFVYRCPNTGLNVQGWVADDPPEGEARLMQPSPARFARGCTCRSKNRNGMRVRRRLARGETS
jgi:hypothetical protein